MAVKNLTGKIEKEVTRMVESLVATVQEMMQAELAKVAKSNSYQTKKQKAPKSDKNDDSNSRSGSLLNSIIDILKESGKPLTESNIAKILLDNPEKYNWKSKSETTLYQTLRRGVKDQKIAESGDRSKEIKTYHVA